MIRMSREEFENLNFKAWDGSPAEAAAKKQRSKYKNTRTTVDGISFDSKHEAEVWCELERRRKSGEFRLILRQVSFPLAGGAYKYRADFVAIGMDFRITVIDAKSAFTRTNRVYINKKKQMMHDYGIVIVEM